MCVWTKKRGSMNAVVLMATPCPKSLHGKGEKWIARNILQGEFEMNENFGWMNTMMMMMFITIAL